MSDREGHTGAPGDDDLSLPKATVSKMITGLVFLLLFSLLSPHLSTSRTAAQRHRMREGNQGPRHRVLCR